LGIKLAIVTVLVYCYC